MDEKQRVKSEWVLVVLSGILSIGVLVVDYLKFDVGHRFLMGGVVVMAIFALFFIPLSLACTLCTHGKRRLLACIFLLLALFFTYVLPKTSLGARLNCLVFRNAREETVELYQKGLLAQTGPNEYMPQNRLLSHTGHVYTEMDGMLTFPLHRGYAKSIFLFYSPDGYNARASAEKLWDSDWYLYYAEE